MLTPENHAFLSECHDRQWIIGVSTARLSSAPRAGLFAWLTEFQNGICAFCGEESAIMEACHIAPGGPKRVGYMQSNIAMGCVDCNDIDKDTLIAFETIKRRDLIATEWPSIPTLTAMGKQIISEREERREAKRILRGM